MKRTTLIKLRRIYYDHQHPQAFSSANSLFSFAREFDKSVTRDDIEDFLSKQNVYTLHRRSRSRFPRRKILSRHIKHIYAADLIDFQNIRKENFGNRYILVIIDVFSRYAYATPMKNKSGRATLKAIQKIFKKGGKPLKLFADKGKEFYNKHVKRYLKSNRILLYSTENETKASIVERFIKSLKTRLYKIFTARNSLNYTAILDEVVNGLNNRFHRAIGRAPSQVNKKNEREVHNFQYGKYLKSKTQKPKFNIDDTVRISRKKEIFRKGYLQTFTKEMFRIVDVLPTKPRTYRIVVDDTNEIVHGTWYENELCRTKKP